MSRSESVELAKFLVQRRFAKKDALLAAGRELRALQAQGVRTPFLQYLLEAGVIDRRAYDSAVEAFSNGTAPAPAPAPRPAPEVDAFAFSSSVVNEVDSPSEVEVPRLAPRELSNLARPSNTWPTAPAIPPTRAAVPATRPPARPVVEEDPTPQVDFDEPDEVAPIGPQDKTVLLKGQVQPEPASGRFEREFGIDRSAAAETIVEMGVGTARPSSWRDQPSNRMDRPSNWGGRSSSSGSSGDRLTATRAGAGAPTPGPTGELNPGDAFGAFKILEIQERRDLGRVYKAHDLDLDRVVVLKVLPENAADANSRRITSQIETLAGLDHPNVMSVYNGGTHAGSKYFTLEFIAGRALAEFVRDEVPPPEKALAIVREVAGAVEYAHRKGLVHETLAPEDVRIDEAANPHLVGFWRAGADDGSNLAALGRLLYLALTGVDPDESTRARRNVVPPDQLDPRIPSEAADLCLRALSRDSDDQFAGAAALVQEIDKCARGLRPSVRRRRGGPGGSGSRARPIAFAAIGIAVLCAIGFGVYHFVSNDGPPEEAKPNPDPDPTTPRPDPTPKPPKPDPPKPEPVPPKARVAARLSITTPSPGCTVDLVQVDQGTFERGKSERIGTTPIANKDLAAGNYLVEISKGPGPHDRMKFPLTIRDSAYGQPEEIRIDYPSGQPEDMVYVPRGTTSAASTTGAVPSFFIDRYPVTNEQYFKFIQATGHAAPPTWRGRMPTGTERHPVTSITASDAWAYALWAGKRLPRSREYTKAISGTDGRRFPWGKKFEGVPPNTYYRLVADMAQATPVEVGRFSQAEGPYGCQDLVGNVFTFLHESGDASAGWRLGGSIFVPGNGGPTTVAENPTINSDPATSHGPIIGFRCVRSEIKATTMDELARIARPPSSPEDRISALYGIFQLGQRAAFERLLELACSEFRPGEEYVRYAAAYYAGHVPGIDVPAEIRRRLESAQPAQASGLLFVLTVLPTADSTQILRDRYPSLGADARAQMYAVLRSRAEAGERVEMAIGELTRATHPEALALALHDLTASSTSECAPLVRRYVEENPLPPTATEAPPHYVLAYALLLRHGEVGLFLEKLHSASPLEGIVAAHALVRSGVTIPFGDALSALESAQTDNARFALLQYEGAIAQKMTREEMARVEVVAAKVRAAATAPELQKGCDQLLAYLRNALKQ